MAFKTEADLAKVVQAWLKEDHWEVYCEVAPWGGGAARADIVATRGPVVSVVETKLSLSLALMEQCFDWKRHAHTVWAAVPYPKRGYVSGFSKRTLESLGIGLLCVTRHGEVRVLARPEFRRKVTSALRDSLVEGHKDFTPGSNSRRFLTPFKITCQDLRRILMLAGGELPVKEAISQLKHHYANDASARSCLLKLAEKGVVEGVALRREGRDVWFRVA